MNNPEAEGAGERVNFAYVEQARQWRTSTAQPPLSEAAESRHAWLSQFAEARAMPAGTEDLDRGDNERLVRTGEGTTSLRMLAQTVHAEAEAACIEAASLAGELAEAGYEVDATSRLGAAAATGPNQERAGWRAFLDVRLVHPTG